MKNFFLRNILGLILVLMLINTACSDDEESVINKEPVCTFTADSISLNFSTCVEYFNNLLGSVTVKARYNDTTYLIMVLPKEGYGTYSNETHGEEVYISLALGGDTYDSNYGTEGDYYINVVDYSGAKKMMEIEFSGRLGTILTELGLESEYLNIKDGKLVAINE
jgi:hypothetical protein